MSETESEMVKLKQEFEQLVREYNQQSNVDIETYLKQRIELLHEYNEIKDIGQQLLGICAEKYGTTVKEMYKKYELDLED
ncbi:hypothetical protein HK103_000056 [Boothiomyces macroporosus]|uniref:DNA repair protein SWI5 homolog n=1 Tax=Boothiomyces macroporosus TaxID=261099 RepID=A0AAD5YBE8_9FUNG|nr:hypothetical protein HK103_000056 [Boothiomyces macroporosus]